jgi:hypothetical protein
LVLCNALYGFGSKGLLLSGSAKSEPLALGRHAAKAKELLEQANQDLTLAAEFADSH